MRQDGGPGLIALAGTFLVTLLATDQSAALPTVSADLDGDGTAETATASSARGGIRVEVRDARGRQLADARAPAPPGDVVPFTLTTAPIGSAGALLEVSAATDSSECVSIWRLRGRALSRVPILDAAGKPLPDCAPPAGWVWRWEAQPGKPSELVRERTESVAAGSLTSREVYAFAGFSLERLPARSGGEINGVPIPSWFPETLLTRSALETLYARFGLEAMRREPELRIETDAARGVFDLRFRVGDRELVASVDAGSFSAGEATLSARAGDRTAHALVRLAGSERNVPMEVRIEGLGAPYDQLYQPAGAWRGGARQVFRTPADELASEQLAGIWSSPSGQTTTLAVEGEGPYRVRSGATLYVPDLAAASPPADLLLRPASGAGTGWALTLRGPNAMDRVPCRFEPEQPSCSPAGPAETLRRLGARVNVR